MTRDQLKRLFTLTYEAARVAGPDRSTVDFAVKLYIYPLLSALLDDEAEEFEEYVEYDLIQFRHHKWRELVELMEKRLGTLFDEWAAENPDGRGDAYLSVIAYGAMRRLPDGGSDVLDLLFHLSGVGVQSYELVASQEEESVR